MTKKPQGKNLLLQYLGFAMQLLFSLGLGVFAGIWADKKLEIATPVFTWVLPLLILVVVLWQVIRDTSKR